MRSYIDYEKARNPIYSIIRDFIIKNKVRTVLDVGCGPGRLLDDIHDICAAEGLDSSEDLLQRCREKGYKVRKGNAIGLPYKDLAFDLVVAKDLVEHVADNVRLVRELKRVAKKFIFLSAVGPVPEFAWGDYTHLRPYTKRALQLLVADQGLQILSVGSVKRQWPFRVLARLYFQPVDDISVYVFAKK
jgi:SAM-dependent methyltransferase